MWISSVMEEIYIKPVFSTLGNVTFYRDELSRWFVETGGSVHVFHKCVGSINGKKNPAISMQGVDYEDLAEQVLEGYPEGFNPGFFSGYYPLFIGRRNGHVRFFIGERITETYEWL